MGRQTKDGKETQTRLSSVEPSGEADPADEGLKARLEAKEKEAAENLDKYLRTAAELDNFRKRAARDKADAIKYGNENVIRDMLPFVDSLDRAIRQAETSGDFDAFRKGLRLIQEQLLCCLERHGVTRIASVGKAFDPNFHEAMLLVESDGHANNEVTEEMEVGYLLNGRLLRPAKVCVCKGRNSEEPSVAACDTAE